MAGLRVYSKPSSSSAVVGKLALHERVTRYKVERGYAYVKVEASGVGGWVNNAMLLWRVPDAPPAAAAAPPPAARAVEAPDEAPEIPAAPPAPEPAPPPPPDTSTTEGSAPPDKPAPSLFDPY